MPVTKIEKSEILLRCWEVFNREGYNHTSIQNLAEATGLGKSGLLHHFGSKEALMHAVIEYSITAFQDYVLAPAYEQLPPDQQLEKLLRRQNRLVKKDRRGCFYANIGLETGRDGQFSELIKHAFSLWQDAVSTILQSAYQVTEARQTAYQMLLEYEGAVLLYKLTTDETHLENLVQRTVSSFRNQLNQEKI
jgi:TetR/AcrR family transcriptional regulator, transcriptional repressor for nem operon